jgi:hypothetical protein
VDRHRKLHPAEWKKLVGRVSGTAFWTLDETKDRTELGNGSRLVVEGLRAGGYRVIAAQDSEVFELRDLCEYMIDLTGFRVD